MLDTETRQLDGSLVKEIIGCIWHEDAGSDVFTQIEPRIAHALATIEKSTDMSIRLGDLIKGSGLSASRFRHLFKAQVGMPFKSYLLWIKLQRAIQILATSPSLTHAAHGAGFADSAHLSRTFRRTFGLAPDDLNRNSHFTTRNLTPQPLRSSAPTNQRLS